MAVGAIFIALSALNPPEQDPLRRDALLLMDAGLWPLGVVAYCNKEVAGDPGIREIAEEWNRRNRIYLERIVEAIKASGDMTKQQRTDLDRKVYREVKCTVESKKDKANYCAEHLYALRKGRFDLHRNPATAEAMQRLMAAELDRRRVRDLGGRWKPAGE